MSPNGMKNNCYSAIKDTAFVDDSLLYHLMYCTYDKHKADKQKSTIIDGELIFSWQTQKEILTQYDTMSMISN